MKKISFLFFTFLLLISSLFFSVQKSSSDELDDITKQINELNSALNMSIKATKPLESQLNSMRSQIAEIKERVGFIEEDITVKKKNIERGYKDLAKQEEILNRTIRHFYIKSYYNSPFLIFLSTQSSSELTQVLAYQKAAADQDKAIITNIALLIQDLETKKRELENEQARLTIIKADLDEQSKKLDEVITGAKKYQATLSGQIAQLSAKQQEIIAQKLGSLNISRSAYSMGRCDSDLTNGRDPGFSPRFALFTYGVPNRVGMNQWGAYGRAKANQGYEEILRAYYNFDSIEKRDVQINVEGYGSFSLDDYAKRIYEVPDSWTDNDLAVLKAQAIAARSYALAYTNNGTGSICTTEQCQVFKPDPKGGNWEQAVNATSGLVMVQGGNPIKAWFSSTHGGYIFSSGEIGWSGTSWTKHANDFSGSVNSFSDLNNNAFDKESPWFYCDWGSRAQYNKTAWLKPEEMADIVNVILLARKDSSLRSHLYQTDKANPEGQETWNEERVKQELGSSAFNSISDISVSTDFSSGRTTNVTVSGNGKSEPFNGSEFKDWFNLRAPANINIVGPLYNVEKQ